MMWMRGTPLVQSNTITCDDVEDCVKFEPVDLEGRKLGIDIWSCDQDRVKYSKLKKWEGLLELLGQLLVVLGKERRMGRRESGAGSSWWWWGVSAVLLGVLVGRSENFVEARGLKDVTCGSVFKLVNHAYKIRLHSHDIKYGSGSGQQSVTGTDVKEDVNSNWAVKGGVKKPCTRGEPVECGSKLRLEHLQTGKNLHSHLFQSPLSGSQEISAFGDSGEGDTGDNWEIVCRGDFWERDEQIQFKHVDTGAYLSASGNTFGRPIHGQMEIVGVRHSDSASYWTASEGIFVHPSEMNLKSNAPEHNEL